LSIWDDVEFGLDQKVAFRRAASGM